jgi:glycerophosphoryl diester phosphodiesterase
MEYSYLKDGIKSRASTKNNDHFPQLENVIKNIPDEVKINIEIKTRKVIDILIVKELVGIIKRMNISHKVLVSSFNPLAIWYAKILDKNIRTGFLYDNPRFLFLKNIIHPDCIHPKQSLVTQNLVKHCKDRGLSVNVWTVNNKAAINWLIKQGVDGIITDNPKYFSKKN